MNKIQNETTLLQAFNETGEPGWVKDIEFGKLSFFGKVTKIVTDNLVNLFALVLGVTLCPKRNSELDRRYEQYIDQHSKLRDNKRIIVILCSKTNDIPMEPKQFEKLKNESGCDIIFHKVGALNETSEAIEKLKRQSCKIEALWIRAHGTPTTMTFSLGYGFTEVFDVTPDKLLLGDYSKKKAADFCNTIDNYLEKSAPIILESCFTGSPMPEGKENIATFISREAKRKTFAPIRETFEIGDGATYQEGEFHVKHTSTTSSRFFNSGSLLARLSVVWNAFRGKKEDITQIFLPSQDIGKIHAILNPEIDHSSTKGSNENLIKGA